MGTPKLGGNMKTYKILIGNCEELLNDFIQTLFQEACGGEASVQCTRTGSVGDFVRHGCEQEFDLLIHVPHNLLAEAGPPTPIGVISESIRTIRAVKAARSAPVISLVAAAERGRYEPLLLEAGADCVLELPFGGETLRAAVRRLLQLPVKRQPQTARPWFYAGVLMRGFKRLSHA